MSGVLYVYAITDTAAAAGGRGLHGAPLRMVESGPLAAVVSEHGVAPEPDEDVLWAHEQVVEELMAAATILPMRFGSSVAGAEELIAFLDERREEFLASLERVRGAVEVSVRAEIAVAPEEEAEWPADHPPSGTAYMVERARSERRGRDAVELVHGPLAALARGSVAPAGVANGGHFKAAYLVEESAVEAFGSRVGELNANLEGVKVSATGPWPPYSFVAERPR